LIIINNLGESGKIILNYAERVCKELNNEQIDTTHLFMGVAELEDIYIRRQFLKAGIDIDEVSRELKQKIKAEGIKENVQASFSPAARKALEEAQNEASRLGDSEAEAPHILLGILEDKDSMVAKILREHLKKQKDADPDKVMAALADNLRKMISDDGWPKKFYDKRKVVEQPGIGKTTDGIDKSSDKFKKIGRDLTADASEGKLNPKIGREKELLEIIRILTGKRKNNPILIGEAGVGKTGVVEGLAQLIADEDVPDELKGKRIMTVEMVSVVAAGAKYFGQFEQKLQELLDEAEKDPSLIIFIDEIHTLMGAQGGAMKAADILKPALSGGRLKCIGATTTGEYRKYIEKDKALDRRFQPVQIDEPTEEDTREILLGLRPKYEEFHGLKILDEAITAAVELSVRYIGGRRLPDKAIDLIDQACSQKKLRSYYGFSEFGELTREEKKDLLRGKKVSTAAANTMMISYEDVARIVADWTGIPVGKITVDEREKLLYMDQLMKKSIFGQDEAIDIISESIKRNRANLVYTKRPIGSFLFVGPTGVGKTELAKTLAQILFDDEERIIQIDMSEFYEKHTLSRLIGSPHGYVDSDLGGQLTEAVKNQPFAVVLFDEIEKAHPEVLKILLQIMEEGHCSDGLGRPVNFKNTVIIMTSNIGSGRVSKGRTIGVPPPKEEKKSNISSDLNKELISKLSPEFVNRINGIVEFNSLSKDHLREIALKMLSRLKVKVETSDEALEFLVDDSYVPAMGARPLRRTIEAKVVSPLANKIIRGEISEYDTVKIGVSDGNITIEKITESGAADNEGDKSNEKICNGEECRERNPATNTWCKKCGRELN